MPECKYGKKCYRKNEDHIREFHSQSKVQEEEKEKKSPEFSSENEPKKRGNKRTIDKEFEEEEITQKKEAKVMKGVEEAEEGEGEEGQVETMEEYETVEEVVEMDEREEGTADPRAHTYLHRSPFSPQPQSIYSLWKKALHHDSLDPRGAFSEINGLRLVGFFDFLAGDLKEATDDEIRIHARYSTDLPEMQTIMVSNAGRYALWRDDPAQSSSFIVYVKHEDDHFTKITMVGDKPVHALVHAAGDGVDAILDKFYPSSVYEWATAAKLKHDAKAAITRRSKTAIGRPLHTMRLNVPVDKNDVGYRSLGVDLNKMKRTMTLIGESTEEVAKKKKMAELREIGTNVQLANDECDFGTGLEFGHDLFIANYPNLDPMAKRYLAMAYQLLGRFEFGAIVNAHMEEGVRRRKKVMLNE
ncbi:hypothetical protein PMAYCL1PPCAC_18772 [Pristionchus mayeri]|uniref:PBZ-type domain-containing protein n=1 Tax=Pristionchus mayeri TaxID=1317129 RepID=A0AAN5CQH9_9BILA|nr:hypothetical protein PMAYCL1PPCAC_18772 [Pristionchus mayeri]